MKFYKIILLLLISFLLNLNLSLSYEGDDFNNILIKKGNHEFPYLETRYDIGVFYDFEWDSKNKNIKIKRNEKNYPIVRFSLFNKKDILPGVIIEKYNNIYLSKLSDNEIEKLHRSNKIAELKILESQNKIKISPGPYQLNDFKLSNFFLESINNINTRKGVFEITFESSFNNDRSELNSYAENVLKDNIYIISEDLRNDGFHVPLEHIYFKEYKFDVDIRQSLEAEFSFDDGKLRTVMSDIGIGQFRQKFDFKKFPFDTQELIITVSSGHRSNSNPEIVWPKGKPSVTFVTPEKGAFIDLEKYIKNNYLKEWKVISTNIESREIVDENYYDRWLSKHIVNNENVLDLKIKIERYSQYYIFKIILPVFLILIVAWSVLWIPTKELESRLTTSIVALLALIAYNFVFEDDIPKLSYLTSLDRFILLSYVFCAIPTFMSVGFSRYIVKNQRMVTKVNSHIRKWGGLIYIFSTFQIFYK